jgi:hypothetical protein
MSARWKEHWTEEEMTPHKRIKAMCWECTGWKATGIDIVPRDCDIPDCPLYPMRPMGSRLPPTLEQRAAMRERAPIGFGKREVDDGST